jgi:SAM-dependent methyltransferase
MNLKKLEETLAKVFPDLATSDDATYFAEHKRRYADVLSLLPEPLPESRLLDVGILPGHLAALAQARGYAVSGLTNTEPPVSFRTVAAKLNLAVRRADIEIDPFPFPDDHFDVVLFSEVIEHLYRDPFAALNEIFRVLKSGGLLVLTTPSLSAIEKIVGLVRGFSYRPALSSPREITFPPQISNSHFREYTDRELVYLLRWQSKCHYWFHPRKMLYSSCWQTAPRESARQGGRPGSPAARLLFWLISRFVRRTRSCLMVRAERPLADWAGPDAFENVRGFHAVETDADTDSLTRHPLPAPFRWTSDIAGLSFTNPLSGATHIRLRAGLMAPARTPPARVTFSLNDHTLLKTALLPRQEFATFTLPIPAELRQVPTYRLTIQSSTWSPSRFGLADTRSLGIMLAWERILLVREDPSPSGRIERLGRPLIEADV